MRKSARTLPDFVSAIKRAGCEGSFSAAASGVTVTPMLPEVDLRERRS